ncbi:MAG: MFS transporter [Spirochaetales bacterium]|nr:MFS transporter [Spirochaetales bacterium]
MNPEDNGPVSNTDNKGQVSSSASTATILAIFASVILLAGGSALQTSAVSLRAGIEGFSDQTIGLISSGFYAGIFAGSFIALLTIRNVGYVRTLTAFASLASATSLAHVLIISPVWWVIFRLVHGMCLSIVLVVVESWLNASSVNKSRGKILSLYGIVYLASHGLAQPLLGVFSPETFRLFAVTSILISLCVLPVGLGNVSGNPQVTTIKIRFVGFFRKSPLGAFGVFVSGLVIGAHTTLAPRFVQSIGLKDASIGLFLFIVALGTIALQLPLGWLSDNKGRRLALIISCTVGAFAAFGLSFVKEGGPFLLGMGFLFGGFAMPLYALSLATVNDQVSSDEMIEAASTLYIFYGIGSVIGPGTAAAGMERFGHGALYIFILLVIGAYLGFTLLRIHMVPKFVVRGVKSRYRTVPRTTAVVYNMLRRRYQQAKKRS